MNKNFTLELEQFESYSYALMHFIEKMPDDFFNTPEFTPNMDLVNVIVSRIMDSKFISKTENNFENN